MFAFDKTIEGWRLVDDVGATPPLISLGQYKLVEMGRKNPSYRPYDESSKYPRTRDEQWKYLDVPSEQLGEHAHKRGANLGQLHAERLFEFQAVLIPPEARKFTLVFPGTVWQLPDGRRCIPLLCFTAPNYLTFLFDETVGWRLGFGVIGSHIWDGDFRLIQPVWTPDVVKKPLEFPARKW